MGDKLKNILIGLFASVAIVSAVLVILFLQPSIGDGKKILKVKFSNIGGINIGTRVSFAGKPIGEVVAINISENARNEITDELGRIYYYELYLKVDSSVEVYSCDEVKIVTTGLMGEKSIGIIPKTIEKNGRRVTEDCIYAKSVDSLENTVYRLSQISNKVDVAVDNFNEWFSENHQNLTSAVTQVSYILNSLDVKEFNSLVSNFSNTSKMINTEGKAFLNTLTQPTGTIGKLLNQDDFYLQLTQIMSKSNTLMNDINHYGLLFQYNKGWQRSRTKRANLINSLSKPQEFKAYFDQEMDTINTSFSRLSILMDKAKETGNDNEALKKDYALLLKKVDALSNSLKLYNEELLLKDSN